jgi:3-hydroxyisobutyrate dehydrogenase-like beta-hydroxyacid dehydrogenase
LQPLALIATLDPSEEVQMIIGVAGCGRMGAPMLDNLRKAGFDARGYDIIKGRGDDHPFADFAQNLTTLITVVRDTDETDDVLFGAQNLTSTPMLRTIIISSTLSPKYVKALRDRVPAHITLIDAPMSGAQVKAKAGTLSFMIGGDEHSITAHMPLFTAMGQEMHIMGDYGSGMSSKVLNNLLAASHTAMTRTILDWADAAGIPEDKLLNLINTSSGQNWLASGFNDIEFARDGFGDDNSIGILVKDVAAGLDMAPNGADTSLPQTVQAVLKTLNPRI